MLTLSTSIASPLLGFSLSPNRVFNPHSITQLRNSHSLSFPLHTHYKPLKTKPSIFIHKPFALLKKTGSKTDTNEDFVTRVLRENPSQVEPKFLIDKKLYSLKEKEDLLKRGWNSGFTELLRKIKLTGRKEREIKREESEEERDFVYLKDILREHRGQLYVPEQIFGKGLSEEEGFNRTFESLPKLEFDDFQKYWKCDKVKLLTVKEDIPVSRDFVVELKDIRGDKSLQRTQWAMRLDQNQAHIVLEQYMGPRYEIEKQTMAWVGQLPEYPHPVASLISSRLIVELGILTAVMATAAVVVGGFLASAVFAVTSFVFAVTVYVVWPVVKPFLMVFLGFILGISERMWDKIVDVFTDGGSFSKLYEVYTFGGVSASLEMLKPIMLVVLTMALLIRFTISRRPKKIRKWDIWQMIDWSLSKPQARVDGTTGVTFGDVAGIDEAVEELQELVRYLKNPDLFDEMGIKPSHGVLLEGPPGCGKTLVAKAIAGEANVPFYQMAGSEFIDRLCGVGSSRIRDLFKRAKVNKPSVIFIDEIDALAARRQEAFTDSGNDVNNIMIIERETTLNQLLVELDGFDTGKGVIFLGATNRMDLLDPALLRHFFGLAVLIIRIRPPNAKGRLDVLKVHACKVKLSNTVDLSTYAQNLQGWTGAKLAQVLQEAALVAVRKGHTSILQSDMDDAVDCLTLGPKRVGAKLGHQGQCRRATTEVGVALTAHLLRQLENAEVESCGRLSINSRGQTLSQVVFNRLDDESYMFERKPQLLHRLQVFLGGRAVEEVIFGRNTSRASVSYLADASWLACKIITIWNMENSMVIHGEPPPWRKKTKFVGPRLDFEESLYNDNGLIEPLVNFNLDDDVAKRTEELMRYMYGRTIALLRRHHAALLKTVKVLLNKKEISGEEIDFILSTYPPHTPVSRILEEKDPGTLSFVKEEKEGKQEVEHSMLINDKGI